MLNMTILVTIKTGIRLELFVVTTTWSELDEFFSELDNRRLIRSVQQLNDFCSEYYYFW